MNKKMTKKQFYLLSCTWGIVMTLIGGIAFLGLKITGHKIHSNQYGYYCEFGKGWGGVSLGPFAIVNKNPSQHLLTHEFGHALQNCYFGPHMIIISLFSAVRYWYREYLYRKGKPLCNYDSVWFEGTATYLGNYYKNN